MDYNLLVRDIPDFPKKGIIFKDITPLLLDREALPKAVEDMAEPFKESQIDLVVGIESRGFMFGPGIACYLGCGFAPVRKPKRLPYQTESVSYDLEYGQDTLEIHRDAVKENQRVLVVDDLLATGGTAAATAHLVHKIGGVVAGFSFLIELDALKGRDNLGADLLVHSIIHCGT